MTDKVEIAGVGMHPFGRFPEKSLKDLARVAAVNALVDAGVGPRRIEAVFASNALGGALSGQHQIRGQSVLRDVGIEGVPVVNIDNACAGGSTALHAATTAVLAGRVDVALAIGFEKMFVDDRTATLDALQSAGDLDVVGGLGLQFTAVYAMRLRQRLDDGSLSTHHLAEVAVKSHYNGSLNPNAQHRQEVTAEQVLNSRPIAEPLTLLMCSSLCDGAAAAVVARAGALDRDDGRTTVRIRAGSLRSGYSRRDDEPTTATLAAREAYEHAGLGPQDIDVAEVHDAMAPGELTYYEQLGFCEPGGAGEMLDRGATRLTGELPVNPSGGLSSRGHPVGATGLAQIAELTWQLRGEAGPRQIDRPRIALAQNSGGWLEGEPAACAVHILEGIPT